MDAVKLGEFKKYVISKLASKIFYNPENENLEFDTIQLSRFEKEEIYELGQNEYYKLTEEEINQQITEASKETIELSVEKQEVDKISLKKDMKVGDNILIEHNVSGKTHTDDLMKIGNKEFLVISHTRGILNYAETIFLKNTNINLNLGSTAQFKLKSKKRKIDIYETGVISKIEKCIPSNLLLSLDSKVFVEQEIYYLPNFNYTIDKEKINHSNFSIHKSERNYIKLELKGDEGFFSIETKNINIIQSLINSSSHLLFPIAEYKESLPDENSKKITTLDKGRVVKSNNHWQIVQKAAIRFEE